MKLQVLSQAGALSSGAELWILPDPDHSGWSQSLDWYLNFQIARRLNCQRRPLPATLKKMIEDFEYQLPQIEIKPSAPLLLASSDHLPNRFTVVLPYRNESLKEWLGQILKIWKDLLSLELRCFLPVGVAATVFQNLWPESEIASTQSITVVLDPNTPVTGSS